MNRFSDLWVDRNLKIALYSLKVKSNRIKVSKIEEFSKNEAVFFIFQPIPFIRRDLVGFWLLLNPPTAFIAFHFRSTSWMSLRAQISSLVLAN